MMDSQKMVHMPAHELLAIAHHGVDAPKLKACSSDILAGFRSRRYGFKPADLSFLRSACHCFTCIYSPLHGAKPSQEARHARATLNPEQLVHPAAAALPRSESVRLDAVKLALCGQQQMRPQGLVTEWFVDVTLDNPCPDFSDVGPRQLTMIAYLRNFAAAGLMHVHARGESHR
jgi:hypothetical protein